LVVVINLSLPSFSTRVSAVYAKAWLNSDYIRQTDIELVQNSIAARKLEIGIALTALENQGRKTNT